MTARADTAQVTIPRNTYGFSAGRPTSGRLLRGRTSSHTRIRAFGIMDQPTPALGVPGIEVADRRLSRHFPAVRVLKGLPDVSTRDSGKRRRLVGAGSADDQVGEGQHEEALGADNAVGNVDAFEQERRSADASAREQGEDADDRRRCRPMRSSSTSPATDWRQQRSRQREPRPACPLLNRG